MPRVEVDLRVDQHRDDHDREGGQEAQGAAGVERAEPDPAAALPLLDEERGDQEPAEDEEDVDPEEPALDLEWRRLDQRAVEEHDREDRDGAHAVERGPVAEVEPGRPRVGAVIVSR